MKILKLDNKATFDFAVECLDQNGNGILPVIDKENKFIGIITDGDIRKALISKKLSLDVIINRNPIVISDRTNRSQRISLLKKIKRRQLPIVNSENIYCGMFTFDELDFKSINTPVVIMAGGLGTRLGSLTKDTPKPMLHVNGKPILENILEKLIAEGFSNFYISVNYKKEVIMDYFGNGERFGINIRYLEESKRLGTAGALSLLDGLDIPEIIITNGDVLSEISFADLLSYHMECNSDATMCTKQFEQEIPYGVVSTKNKMITAIEEKPKVSFKINSGIYCLSQKVLKYIPDNEYYDITSLFTLLLSKKYNVISYNTEEFWVDIGNPEELKRVNENGK